MRKFKKISAFLSILLAFSISAGTFSFSVLAEDSDSPVPSAAEYTIPNSSVLSDFFAQSGGGSAQMPIDANFPSEPSFSLGTNNSWETSLSQKSFSFIKNNSADFTECIYDNMFFGS